MIPKEEIAQMIKEELKDPNSMVPIALVELLMLREQLRPRKYPDEKPQEIYAEAEEKILIYNGHDTYVGVYDYKYWNEDDGVLENIVSWMPLPFMEIDHD